MRSTELLLGLSEPEMVVLDRINQGIEDAKPALFNMTDQVLDAFPDKRWNLLIGDDTSGRLATRFVRSVFRQSGFEIPTRYIEASSATHEHKPASTYTAYAQHIADSVKSPRALFITESTAKDFRTLRFINRVIGPQIESLDAAIIVTKTEPTDDLMDTYCGAVCDDGVMDAVWRGFENPTNADAERAWSDATNNLAKNFNPEQAHAKRSDEIAYRSLAAYCYTRMPELAAEYLDARIAQAA